MIRTAYITIFMAVLCANSFANDSRLETEKWEQKYQQLLKDRPEVRKKVDSGGATKEQVIEWLKKGGDKQRPAGKRKYYGQKIEVKDPAAFRPAGGEVIFSGPQPGEKLPPFSVIGISGALKDKEFNPVASANGKPHVLIFQDTDGATFKGLYFLGPVFDRIKEKSKSDLQVSVVLLGDKREDAPLREIEFYQKSGECFQFSHTLDGREGPGIYGLNRHMDVTILVAKGGAVLHNFVFPSPVFAADPHVLGAVADIIGKDRQTVAGWFEEPQTQ